MNKEVLDKALRLDVEIQNIREMLKEFAEL